MHKRWPAYQVTAKSSFDYDNLFFLVFSPEDVGLLCQFRLRWLMNQLLICFSCNPVSCTSRALSSSCISGDRGVVYHEQKLVAYVSSEMVFTCVTYSWVWPLGMSLPPSLQYGCGIPRKFTSSALAENFFSDINELFFVPLQVGNLLLVNNPP